MAAPRLEVPLRRLLLLLVAGALGFIALAMAQERDVFLPGSDRVDVPALTHEEQKQAADTLHRMLTVMEHLYASGGDTRFAERMPASEAIVGEIMADVLYLERNRRRQRMSLERLDVLAVDSLAPDAVELQTRERWSVRYLRLSGEPFDAHPERQVVHARYGLVRGPTGWSVARWDLIEPPGGAP